MDSDTDAVLTITGTEVASESVSVEVLVHLLQGFQQLALVFAASAEDRPLQQRFKPAFDLRQRYCLRCGVSHSGSYAVPLRLVDETTDNLLPNEEILPRIARFIGAVAAGDRAGTSAVIPDSRYRDRALLALRSMAPRKGERWKACPESLGNGMAVYWGKIASIGGPFHESDATAFHFGAESRGGSAASG